VVKKLNSIVFPISTKKQPSLIARSSWQIFICHNKVGGFRQVAFKNDKILFTRLISSAIGESPDFVVGNIEQEVQNSFEYLKRLSLKEGENCDIYFIVSQEVKNRLIKVKFKSKILLYLLLMSWEKS